MPAVYENFGVRFLYPENWTITDEEIEDWPRMVTLQSPETSFLTLYIYPPLHQPRQVVDEIIGTISGEYGELEVLPAKETIGDALTRGVDIAFFYLDLLVEAKIRSVKTPSALLVWHYQAESREFDKMEPVFQAMATSLLATQVPLAE